MKTILIAIIVIMSSVFIAHYSYFPKDHLLYPAKSQAHAKFYNHSSEIAPIASDVIFTLVPSLGNCDKIGRVEIKTNGDIGVCTATGWKIQQPDS